MFRVNIRVYCSYDRSFSIKIEYARNEEEKSSKITVCLKMKSRNLQQGSIKEHRRGGYPQKEFTLEERERSNMILGHYKWESNGVAVHRTGKGIGRAKPQSGGNRGNSRVIFQRRIRHNRRRTVCQNVNLCPLFWFNWKELIIMAHCSSFSPSLSVCIEKIKESIIRDDLIWLQWESKSCLLILFDSDIFSFNHFHYLFYDLF